jgi:dTDP-4-amino-4,6-dideoxygalactose transaminase
MDAFQAAVLSVKLRHIEAWTEARIRAARRYAELLAPLPLRAPYAAPDRRHVWHLYVVLLRERDRVRKELEAQGIQTGLHYPIPLHLQRAYAHLGHRRGEFPVAERVGDECLTLPLFPEITPREQEAVVEALARATREVAVR